MRLKLDFSLSGADRLTFINSYLPTLPNPTPEELETIANYLLWATPDRKELRSKGIIPPSKSNDWDTQIESLEALSENPAVDESSFRPLDAPQIRIKKEKFSRAEARKEAPPFILSILENLFTKIDELDFQISVYELKIGKRTEPIRASLVERIMEARRQELEQETKKWNQHLYLKARHLLIQLRSDQFMLRDSYKQNVGNSPTARTTFYEVEEPTFEAGINVFPLGLFKKREEAKKESSSSSSSSKYVEGANTIIFKKNPSPSLYTPDQIKLISDFYWENQRNLCERATKVFFDFRNEEHVYQLILLRRSLSILNKEEDSTIPQLFDTLDYYIGEADLTEAQREILDLKFQHKENQDIAGLINRKYGKNYAPNYISTIFKQKIVKKICEAVSLHYEKISNLFFEEEFKKCSCCGRELLKREDFFMRRKKAPDGFNGRCKLCDREKRKEKKEAFNLYE